MQCLRFFGGVYQLPALIDREAGRNLNGHMLAMLHGVNRNGGMQLPVGANVHQVDVGVLAKRLPARFARVFLGLGAVVPSEDGLAGIDALGDNIAECNHFHALDVHVARHGIATPHPQPHKSNTNGVDWLAGEQERIGLSGWPGRLAAPYHLRVVGAIT
jgi:hypothetical protein